jgi:hypothetical protein
LQGPGQARPKPPPLPQAIHALARTRAVNLGSHHEENRPPIFLFKREREREEKTAQGANRWRHEKPMERGAKEHT